MAGAGDGQPEERGEDSEPGRVDRWIEPFFSEPTLWPVLIVLMLSLVTIGAAALLTALSARNPWAILALLLLAGVSLEAVWRNLRRGRLGRSSTLILTLWLLSGATAVAARRLGLF